MATKYNSPLRRFAKALGIKEFPVFSTIVDEKGKTAKVSDDGELYVTVSGDLNIGDVTLDGVTIKDKQGNEAKVTPDGSQLVHLTGSLMEHYGATLADRPAANTVPVGATFELVGSDDIWQSNGTEWVVL